MTNIETKKYIKPTAKVKTKYNLFRNRVLLLIDMLIVIFAYFVTPIIVDGINHAADTITSDYETVIISMFIFAAAFVFAKVYTVLWIHASVKDYARIVYAGLAAAVMILMVNNVMVHLKATSYGPRQTICALFIILVFMVFARMLTYALYSVYREKQHTSADVAKKRLLIIGAGSAAMILIKDMAGNDNLNYDVVGFVDDDKQKHNAIIYGVRVLGNRYDIKDICIQKAVDEILIAIPSAGVADRREILEICNETGCKTKILPSIDQVISGVDTGIEHHVRDVEIEDLLAREPIRLDNTEISEYIEGKTIMVTGGGGSIGSELCRQIMKYNPEKMVVLDIYENNAYDLQMELNAEYGAEKIDVVIASVRDKERLLRIFKKYKPYIVFHAAAHKHVPLMEANPSEAIKNNVFGTLNAAQCADECGAKRFVLISTDKAVNPTNIMGATKRVCEMIVQCAQANSKTEFVAVRFGNVLGSNGSVIPLFKKQIESGGPVTVTHKDITRFFMTIPEATQLVLQAASYAKGGEIFVLDMGEPVRIYDLAKNLIRLSGYKPDIDIKIEVCGLRPGEKLYEELLMNEEGLKNTEHNKIFIGKPIDIEKDKLFAMLADLQEAADKDDVEAIKDSVERVVPTYIRNQQ